MTTRLFNPSTSVAYPVIIRATGERDGVTLAPRGRLLLPQGASVAPESRERYPLLEVTVETTQVAAEPAAEVTGAAPVIATPDQESDNGR